LGKGEGSGRAGVAEACRKRLVLLKTQLGGGLDKNKSRKMKPLEIILWEGRQGRNGGGARIPNDSVVRKLTKLKKIKRPFSEADGEKGSEGRSHCRKGAKQKAVN